MSRLAEPQIQRGIELHPARVRTPSGLQTRRPRAGDLRGVAVTVWAGDTGYPDFGRTSESQIARTQQILPMPSPLSLLPLNKIAGAHACKTKRQAKMSARAPLSPTVRCQMRGYRIAVVVLTMAGCVAPPNPNKQSYSVNLSGTVIDSMTRKPIPGATIQLESKTIWPPVQTSTSTTLDGTFSIQIAKPNEDSPVYQEMADGYCTSIATVTATGFSKQVKKFSRLRDTFGTRECSLFIQSWVVALEKSGT